MTVRFGGVPGSITWVEVLNGTISISSLVSFPVRNGNVAEIILGRVVALEAKPPTRRRADPIVRVLVEIVDSSNRFNRTGRIVGCTAPIRIVKISPRPEDAYRIEECLRCKQYVRYVPLGNGKLLCTVQGVGYTSYCSVGGENGHAISASGVAHAI